MEALFVLPVEGQPVRRYGTSVLVGAMRDLANPRRIVWDPDRVVMIPADEFRTYRREYLRALASGSLVRSTSEAWRDQNPDQPAPGAPARRRRKPRTG